MKRSAVFHGDVHIPTFPFSSPFPYDSPLWFRTEHFTPVLSSTDISSAKLTGFLFFGPIFSIPLPPTPG